MYFFFSLGDITQKGYEKKRAKLLARYIPLIQGEKLHGSYTFMPPLHL